MQSLPSEKPTAGYSHPWQYFLLVYALSAPFWLLSLFLKHSPLPDNLPLTDIGAALTPTIAAALLRYREGGMAAVRSLFGRVFDYGRIKHSAYFWTAILIFPPALSADLCRDTPNRTNHTCLIRIVCAACRCVRHVLYCGSRRGIGLCCLCYGKSATAFYPARYGTDYRGTVGIVAFAVHDCRGAVCRTDRMGAGRDGCRKDYLCMAV